MLNLIGNLLAVVVALAAIFVGISKATVMISATSMTTVTCGFALFFGIFIVSVFALWWSVGTVMYHVKDKD